MPDVGAGAQYSIDTNSLMDWQARYSALVREELDAVGTAGLIQWARASAGMFVPTGELLASALAIQNQFTGLRDPRAEYEEADAYVIALAQIRGGIVVTQETPAAEKNRPRRTHFIPDVCRELGVPCISLLGLMRRERWVL